MRLRWTPSTLFPLLAASVIACGDSTGTDPQDLVDVLLDFCSDDTPVFVAVQNEGDDFERIQPTTEGTFGFQAAPAFILAIVHEDGGLFSTEYVFATPDEIEPLNGLSCTEQFGSKALAGTIAGVPAGSATMVSMASSFDYVTSPANTYSLTDLPSGPLDLIAQREGVGIGGVVPDKVIIRRAQDRTSGSNIPVLDFSAAEAQSIALNSFTVTGVSSGDDNVFLVTFSTPTTRGHAITALSPLSTGTNTLYGIPAALTQSGDFHELFAFADGGAAYRGELHFYRNPGNRTVSLGAALGTPDLTTVPDDHLRLRTRLNSQGEYGSLITVAHLQEDREVILTATAGWFGGTPGQWDVTIPDPTGMSGFPSGALLVSGAGTDWFVDAYGGDAASFFGLPADGAVLQFAGRAFSTNAMQVARGQAGARRPASLMRRRGIGAAR